MLGGERSDPGPSPAIGNPENHSAEGSGGPADDAPGPKKLESASGVLLTLCAAQFLMTLDASVMNVSISYIAEDLGTTVTGIQTAITLYTLVMATLMITGGKIGALLGRRRVFAIGCLVYGAGSLITAISPNLALLLVGWSLLEGIGAVLIMPAVVALVAANFAPERRTYAYGLVYAAAGMAIAAGPLIGGAVTTFASWRWVFVGEVVVALAIAVLSRRIRDTQANRGPVRLDFVGAGLSVIGLGAIVYGVLRSSEWGWVQPKTDGTELLGISPTLWLLLGGLLVMWLFLRWQKRLERRGREPLIRPALLQNSQLKGGLLMFNLQFFVQAGTFFVLPLFLSVVLELSALQTGVRLVPLSLALLVTAISVPKLWPNGSPRRIVRRGLLATLVGIVLLVAGIDLNANAGVVAVPLLLMGAGIGALASQLGSVTVSAVDDTWAPEVGGLQNTATNLGASLGTALAGAVLISALTSSFLQGVTASPVVPDSVKQEVSVALAPGIPFLSDADLETALQEAGTSVDVAEEILATNREARITGLRVSLSVVALVTVVALFLTGMLPRRAIGARDEAMGKEQGSRQGEDRHR